MEKEENGIGFGTAIEQPQVENEHTLKYWLKNHKFTTLLFLTLIVTTLIGIWSIVQQMIKDWKNTLLLIGALSPILSLGIVAIIWAIIDNKRTQKKRFDKRI